jgi:hypothetical protein
LKSKTEWRPVPGHDEYEISEQTGLVADAKVVRFALKASPASSSVTTCRAVRDDGLSPHHDSLKEGTCGPRKNIAPPELFAEAEYAARLDEGGWEVLLDNGDLRQLFARFCADHDVTAPMWPTCWRGFVMNEASARAAHLRRRKQFERDRRKREKIVARAERRGWDLSLAEQTVRDRMVRDGNAEPRRFPLHLQPRPARGGRGRVAAPSAKSVNSENARGRSLSPTGSDQLVSVSRRAMTNKRSFREIEHNTRAFLMRRRGRAQVAIDSPCGKTRRFTAESVATAPD